MSTNQTTRPASIYDDYNYEPTHYYVDVNGTTVAGPMPWEEAERDREETEDRAEPGEVVELVEASRGYMELAGKVPGVHYKITLYRDRKDLDAQIVREGGLLGALEAGIVADHMPEGDTELRAAWERLEAAFKPYAAAEDEVNRVLNDVS